MWEPSKRVEEMKLLGAFIGLAIALALNYWVPNGLSAFSSSPSIFSGATAIAAALTTLWAVAFQRLSSFDKLDDLSVEQKVTVISTARRFRRAIIFSLSINAFVLISAIVLIMLSPTINAYSENLLGMCLLVCAGVWSGGFVQSIKCVENIETSRQAIVATQEEMKRRAAYLQKMREDEANAPVDRNDPHLNSYTRSAVS